MFYYEYEKLNSQTMSALWNLINNASPSDWWREHSFVQYKINVTKEVFIGNPKTEALLNRFVEPKRLYIQKLEPKTSYNWHRDAWRNVSISMGMNVFTDSMTLFGDTTDDKEINHIHGLDPLYYKPDTVYLTNGSLKHCGINFSNETRYQLSISLTRPMSIELAVDFLKKNCL